MILWEGIWLFLVVVVGFLVVGILWFSAWVFYELRRQEKTNQEFYKSKLRTEVKEIEKENEH